MAELDILKRFQEIKETGNEPSEQERQLVLSEVLSAHFKEHFSFVGFYDAKPNDFVNIHIGEFFTNAEIHPCGSIKYGKG